MPAPSPFLFQHTVSLYPAVMATDALGGPTPTYPSATLTGVKVHIQRRAGEFTERKTPDLESFVTVTHRVYTATDVSAIKEGARMTVTASPVSALVNKNFEVAAVKDEGDMQSVWTLYVKEEK